MSLQFVIDAYNLTNHPAFKPVSKSALNIQHALADFIKFNKLTGSKNNQVFLVFDGYPPSRQDIPRQEGLRCLFSGDLEADELIKRIVEESASPKNIVVVSDDKEIQLTTRFLHAQVCSVNNFIGARKQKRFPAGSKMPADDFTLSFAKAEKINAELKKRWLK